MRLVELIVAYINAKAELDASKSDCEGSWGYHLHDLSEKVDSLSDQIDAKIIELVTQD